MGKNKESKMKHCRICGSLNHVDCSHWTCFYCNSKHSDEEKSPNDSVVKNGTMKQRKELYNLES
jgi:hypothetical protein